MGCVRRSKGPWASVLLALSVSACKSAPSVNVATTPVRTEPARPSSRTSTGSPQQNAPVMALRDLLNRGDADWHDVLARCDSVLRGQVNVADLWLECGRRALGPALLDPSWLEVALRHAEAGYAVGATAQQVAALLLESGEVAEKLRIWPLVKSAYGRVAGLPVPEAGRAAVIAKCSASLTLAGGEPSPELNQLLSRAGRRAMRGARYAQASETLAVASTLSDDTAVRQRLIDANLKAGRVDCAEIEAQRLLQDARSSEQRAHTWFSLGLIYEAQGDRERAHAAFVSSNEAMANLEAARKLRGPNACAVSFRAEPHFQLHDSAQQAAAAMWSTQSLGADVTPNSIDDLSASNNVVPHRRAGLDLRVITGHDSAGRGSAWVIGKLEDGSLFTLGDQINGTRADGPELTIGHFNVTQRWVTYDAYSERLIDASYFVDLELKRAWSIAFGSRHGRYRATDDEIVITTDGCTERLTLRDLERTIGDSSARAAAASGTSAEGAQQ